MSDSNFVLDDEAEKLFGELGGIDAGFGDRSSAQYSDQVSETLLKIETRLDSLRVFLIETVYLLSSTFVNIRYLKGMKSQDDHFQQFADKLQKLAEQKGHDGTILIRYRGFPTGEKKVPMADYVITFANITVDTTVAIALVKRLGIKMSHLQGRLDMAYKTFSEYGINNLYIKIPVETPEALSRLRTSMMILSGYKYAITSNSPIVFQYQGEETTVFPVVNEKNLPDPNLTLVAGLNRLSPRSMADLISKVQLAISRSSSESAHHGVYNTLFSIKTLKDKIIRPPVEMNNIKWLVTNRDKEIVSKEKGELASLIWEQVSDYQDQPVRMMESIYGNDFDEVDSQNLSQRLKNADELLDLILKKQPGHSLEKEMLDNLYSRLGQVKDDVFDQLVVRKDEISICSDNKETLVGKFNAKLIEMISFFKRHAVVNQKMKNMISTPFNFQDQDYEVIAKDFNISVQNARKFIQILKSCFDVNGRFQKSIFERNINEFIQFGDQIFSFLWHYLKETLHRRDRVIFLNSLQQLIFLMKSPQLAVNTLIKEFFTDPSKISFSDRNAFMLANILIRKYNKERNMDIELTPEEILRIKDGLDTTVTRNASRFIGSNQGKFFDKIRTIHKRLICSLGNQDNELPPMPVRFLALLEREIYIFLALIGGYSAYSVLLSGIVEYGNPESDIYHLEKSRLNISLILQNLKVLVRSLGRIGKRKEDIDKLTELKNKQEVFLKMEETPQHKETIKRIISFADKAMESIFAAIPK